MYIWSLINWKSNASSEISWQFICQQNKNISTRTLSYIYIYRPLLQAIQLWNVLAFLWIFLASVNRRLWIKMQRWTCRRLLVFFKTWNGMPGLNFIIMFSFFIIFKFWNNKIIEKLFLFLSLNCNQQYWSLVIHSLASISYLVYFECE